jgi:hypothetical protein
MPFLDLLYVYDARIDFTGPRNEADFTIAHKGSGSQLVTKLRRLIDEKYVFRRMIVTTHGYPGAIKIGFDTIYANDLKTHFANQGLERLFLTPGGHLLFNGCQVAAEPGGGAFLLTAAQIFFRLSGGTASGWTSNGHQNYIIPSHVQHWAGAVVSVNVAPGGIYIDSNFKMGWAQGQDPD